MMTYLPRLTARLRTTAPVLGRSVSVCAALILAVPLAVTPAYADVRSGVAAWEAGDYARAITEWRPLALRGDADAQFNLGQAYKLGRGVPQDLAQAADWFRRAAMQNHLQSEDNLGLVLYELGQKADALPWLQRSAARGEPRTQYVLGAELFNGERISRDWPRAYALMKRASDAGLQRAAAALAQMDQHIPLEQRQRGLELAGQMEQTEAQARVAAMSSALPPRTGTPPTIRPTDLPASAPGTTYTPPPLPGGTVVAAPAATPATPPLRTTRPAPAPTRVTPPAPSARPTPAPAASVASGGWRVQLGAFSSRSNAQALWARIGGRLTGAQPSYVAAGSVVRLQAGPYANRAAADRACAAVRPNACFAVER